MSGQQKVKVKTYLPARPLPPNSERKPILTERLVIRPYREEDLDGIYIIHRQPEPMKYTMRGRIDDDKTVTRENMAKYMPPNDLHTYSNVICLASTGEIIGTGGVSRPEQWFGWPEIGYLFKKEAWGRGYGTEFVKAMVSFWWTLPRAAVELEVAVETVDGPGEAPEMLAAMVEQSNIGSQRVLEKAGFREFRRWSEPDNREGRAGTIADVMGYAISSVGQKGYHVVASGGVPVLEPTDNAPV
ncbi:acyl-CoA N-acyltransferase [Hypoxylon sp. FL1284]|nr:acyl-CoA N-acyltransferase [Hypoxylon sp. FL1284]